MVGRIIKDLVQRFPGFLPKHRCDFLIRRFAKCRPLHSILFGCLQPVILRNQLMALRLNRLLIVLDVVQILAVAGICQCFNQARRPVEVLRGYLFRRIGKVFRRLLYIRIERNRRVER